MADPILSSINLGLGWERLTDTADSGVGSWISARIYSGNADRIFLWTDAYNSTKWAKDGTSTGNVNRIPLKTTSSSGNYTLPGDTIKGLLRDAGASGGDDAFSQLIQTSIISPHCLIDVTSSLSEGELISAVIYRPSRVEEEEDELW